MNNDISLYIHIPFCKQKCLYCDFTSYCGKESQMLSYSKALSTEIDNIKDKKVKTIFIGGGTPTYLSLEGWNILKKSIDKLQKSEDLEFTVESNPKTFDKEKLEILKSMGVNRISIGLQAWQNKHLKALGRIHTREEFLKSYNMAREVGFENINVDLMFGIPNQSFDEWKETLNEIIKLNPEHLSCYSLIIEEDTPFYNLYENQKINLPSEELERKMYWYTLKFLKEKGYHQYEISNFSKENKECRHNLVYWDLNEYIGCGVAAHSYSQGYRYNNSGKIEEYIKLIENNQSPIVEKVRNSLKSDIEEFIFMGLRKIKGISIEEFHKRFKKSIYELYSDVIAKHKSNGLIIEYNGYLFLSDKGVEVSNYIMSDFLLD
ncbi:oxygen-independent coproporphyrinogen III oxidase [Clostridium botulinum C]|uniref:Heme chaperone HemW n=2 Tax=Clostridium botulinum TaxID=1491 RepID=A0A9Q4TGY2_CLOBO|nr:radical SAM family heme chaperone HemW [Clostridium botulinum]MCD3195392.1 oxygen-independent coproporphyrinogen III oxidase [Clostridium botulinum C]MCD3200730.1 oxygen-independent coproporphyrinogen III oxidase [Clostridium botulinum C]MCD3206138.1 oxygen-independent coproporphyrinogen III oxidase [Clostridium botulinum C]MCD3208734.1 oxygen-independent coproporphyrinogen III oxidase [Clostridium botulinum C]MCD3225568.1 oxygen-independent coproporphyrinogen III oxidase [Clostridium botul